MTKQKKTLEYGGESLSDYFREYFPEVGILVIEEEAGGEYVIDLNDSNKYEVGRPANHATSPDGRLRITAYHPGGAADHEYWFLEKWDSSDKKYKFVTYINNNKIMPQYIDGFFWIDDDTVLFHELYSIYEKFYEVKVIIK